MFSPHLPRPRVAPSSTCFALLVLLPGCGDFDRGPEGAWDTLSDGMPEEGVESATERGFTPAPFFEPAMVEGLPAPARRFLLRAIAEGTPLAASVELAMTGTIRLDRERDPLPMTAVQVLAPPRGFIWSARAGSGLLRIRGFDRFSHGTGEMRWRLFGVLTVMRATGDDVTRSAAGRLAMEGVLLPSALVPRPGGSVVWEEVDEDHARFTLSVGPERVTTTLQVDPEGRPLRAWADRWNEGKYERVQVELSGSFTRDGYTLPERVEAGWRLGEPDAFPFFAARLTDARFR